MVKRRVKKQLSFSNLFSQTWNDYWKNFKLIFLIILVLSFIPMMIVFVLQLPYTDVIAQLSEADQIATIQILLDNPNFMVFLIISTVVFMILSFIMSLVFIYATLQNKKLTLKASFSGSLKYFWKYLGLSIVVFFALLGLYILLIIPGIIFTIFWIFAAYVLIAENKKIIESMKASKKLVRGKWWKVFGYCLLFGVIWLGAIIIVTIPFSILQLFLENYINWSIFVNTLRIYAQKLVFVFWFFFLKNFYVGLKK